ncbi:alpha-amylase family glycosyl hydrolase [Segatella buccae]|uniref:alpha-amylase family glycosyl hydrolase n=1 Tax=Segatella buccae TaxID=28126 RepID=UPI003FD76765
MKRLLLLVQAMIMALCVGATEGDGFRLANAQDVVMYQVNPRVFAPHNSLRAVAARADSIKALGVNVVWVMPIYPIGEVKSKNSPYSIRDYKAVAPEFGTIDDFKHLVKVCHERGMAVILDWVANHTAWDSPWITEHPEWYVQKNGEIVCVNFDNQVWEDVADLNYDNHYMRLAMIDAMKYWVTEVGLDGFRCDVADGVPTDFWHDAIAELRAAARPRDILMLAEGKVKANFTTGGFDMDYGWNYKDALVSVFVKGASAQKLIDTDREEYASLPEGKVKLRFTTNHDQSTHATPVKEFINARGAMAAYVSAIFIHGGALIYGSQEVGYPNPINFFHYVPVNWMANPQTYREYQKLIGLYNQYPALRKGNMTPFATADVLAFEKSDADGNRFLVVANVRNKAGRFSLPAAWAHVACTNVYTDKITKTGEALRLKPFEYVILKSLTSTPSPRG